MIALGFTGLLFLELQRSTSDGGKDDDHVLVLYHNGKKPVISQKGATKRKLATTLCEIEQKTHRGQRTKSMNRREMNKAIERKSRSKRFKLEPVRRQKEPPLVGHRTTKRLAPLRPLRERRDRSRPWRPHTRTRPNTLETLNPHTILHRFRTLISILPLQTPLVHLDTLGLPTSLHQLPLRTCRYQRLRRIPLKRRPKRLAVTPTSTSSRPIARHARRARTRFEREGGGRAKGDRVWMWI